MNHKQKTFLLTLLLVSLNFVVACSSGGGGGDGSSGGSSEGAVWNVQAAVTQDGCGERIAPVTQQFTVSESGDSVVVDTSLISVTGSATDSGFLFGFEETNGGCTRSYSGEFSNVGGSTADVTLRSETNCSDGVVCLNLWGGTATRAN